MQQIQTLASKCRGRTVADTCFGGKGGGVGGNFRVALLLLRQGTERCNGGTETNEDFR